MAEEKKTDTAKEEDTADADTTTDDTSEDTTKEDDTEDGEKANKNTEIDHEAAAIEEEKRGKPDPIKAAEAFKDRHAKKDDGTDVEDDGDKPLTKKDLTTILSQERRERDAADIARIAGDLAATPAEARHIMAVHKNRTFPEGMPLREQLEESHLIANKKKIVADSAELRRALIGKDTTKRDAAGTHRDATPGAEPKLAANDAHAIKSAGMVWDATKRVYKKPLGNGKQHLYFDPKSRKRWKA